MNIEEIGNPEGQGIVTSIQLSCNANVKNWQIEQKNAKYQ